jgi:hypothetical protein
MDYADIYYVDPRNADPVRTFRPGTDYAGRVPLRPIPALPPAAAPGYPVTAVTYPPAAAPGYPVAAPVSYPATSYPQPSYQYPSYPMPPYGVPPWGTSPPWGNTPLAGNLSALVGGFGGLGSLADVIAQIFAAVMPLPAAPNPIGSDVADTNTSIDTNANTKNLITYQTALASYAKRDEQIRTIGSLLKKLVG